MKKQTLGIALLGFFGALVLLFFAITHGWLHTTRHLSSDSRQFHGPDCAGNPNNPVMFPPIDGFSYGIAGSSTPRPQMNGELALTLVVDNLTHRTVFSTNCEVHWHFAVVIYDAAGNLFRVETNCEMRSCRFNGGGTDVKPNQCIVGEKGLFDPIYINILPRGVYDIVLVPVILGSDDHCQAPLHKPDGPAFRITVE
jgi:hypothetical protein